MGPSFGPSCVPRANSSGRPAPRQEVEGLAQLGDVPGVVVAVALHHVAELHDHVRPGRAQLFHQPGQDVLRRPRVTLRAGGQRRIVRSAGRSTAVVGRVGVVGVADDGQA